MLKTDAVQYGKKYKVYYDREVKNVYYSLHSCVVPFLTKYNCAAVVALASDGQNNLRAEAEKTLIEYHHKEMHKVVRINRLQVIKLLPLEDEQRYPLIVGKGFFSCRNVAVEWEGDYAAPENREFGEALLLQSEPLVLKQTGNAMIT